jgi:hypothetical protein
MLVPAAVARAFFASTRKSLDGYVIGALGALSFTAAVSMTLLAPEMATGLIARGPPVSTLIAQGAIWGVGTPLIAAAVGGLFGVALWFAGPEPSTRRWPAAVRAGLSVTVGLVLSTALYLTDFLPITYEVQLGLYLLVTALALLALRIGLQAALLYEAHDDPDPDASAHCPQCDHAFPGMAFCPNCGVALGASSPRGASNRRLLSSFGGALAVATAVVATVSVPARLRAPAVRRTGRDQPTLHVEQRGLLGHLPRQ